MKKKLVVSLVVEDFSSVPDFSAWEEKIAEYWEKKEIFAKQLAQTKGRKEFVFYDGPPFATGLPHYGHLLASTTKDVFPRFQTMLGKHVARVWGWDCHGLPIENIIEKKLGLKDRQAIEKYGVGNFCESCRCQVQLYVKEWKKTIKRLGRFVDLEHAYKTMDPEFMDTEWQVFGELWDKGLIYRDYKPMHVCPRCATPLSNFEVTLGYKEVTDLSVYVKFKLTSPDDLILAVYLFLVAWTTTAWTLPGNLLLAVDNEIEYSVVEVSQPELEKKEYLILASERVMPTLGELKYQVVRTMMGSELVGRTYLPLMPYFAKTSGAFRIVDADFVTTAEGTGIVHIAPGFGEDDFYLGKREGLPVLQHVNLEGEILPVASDFAGMKVRDPDDPQAVDVAIIKYLIHHGALLRKQKIKHAYPHCWRCDQPLLNFATSSYFVKVTAFKDKLIACNQQVNWLPANFREGRMGNWLAGARDWAVSRSRFWGTPIPLWQNEAGELVCVRSKAELEKWVGHPVPDLHKHLVDQLVLEKEGQKYKRVPEVFDCWYESGSMPYFSKHFPADFISEGQDQTRGWFYTLLVLGAALKGQPAFQNVIVSGIILAADGKKMSKKLENYPDPAEIFTKYGADALRLYLMTSPVIKAESLNFKEKEVARLRRQVTVIAWNCLVFWRLSSQVRAAEWASEPGWGEASDSWHLLDRFWYQRTRELILQVSHDLLAYNVNSAGRSLIDFVGELSTFYVRLSRERLKKDSVSQKVLGWSLGQLALLLAPIMPFFSELLYHNLGGQKESVHLESWPLTEAEIETRKKIKVREQDLGEKIALLKEVMTLGNGERKKLGIKNRQPLASLDVEATKEQSKLLGDQQLQAVLAAELNVKKINLRVGKKLQLAFATELTPELIAEGQARELMREIAGARKKAGLLADAWWTYEVQAIPEGWQAEIEAKTKTQLKIII